MGALKVWAGGHQGQFADLEGTAAAAAAGAQPPASTARTCTRGACLCLQTQQDLAATRKQLQESQAELEALKRKV